MDPLLVAWLASPAGREATRRAEAVLTTLLADPSVSPVSAPLAAAQRLRAPSPADADTRALTPEQAAAVLTQVDLARRAGLQPGRWVLTRDGLEQATAPAVAARHAQHLARLSGAVVDLGAGLGFDAAAMVEAGLVVTAVELDPVRVACLTANVPEATVIPGDLTDSAVLAQALANPAAVVFADPGRRGNARQADGRRAHPERDPQRWTPPWSFLVSLAEQRRLAAKVAAGIPRSAIPDSWQVEWVSVDGTLIEAFVTNSITLPFSRQAAVLRQGQWQTLPHLPDLIQRPGNTVQAFIHEVDPAVIAASASGTLAARMDATILTDDGRWLTSTALPSDQDASFLRSYAVVEELPHQPTALRAALRVRGITQATIKSRGRHQERLRRELRLNEGTGPILAFIDGIGPGGQSAQVLRITPTNSAPPVES